MVRFASSGRSRRRTRYYRPTFDILEDRRLLSVNSDLVPTNLTAPVVASPGDAIEITWRETNIGSEAISLNWYDLIVLKDGSDLEVVSLPVQRQDAGGEMLAPGESRDFSQTILIPSELTGGSATLSVQVNAYQDQFESNFGNNSTSLSIEIQAPKLVAIALEAPATALVGDVIHVSWTVENQGDLATRSPWSDYILLKQANDPDSTLWTLDAAFFDNAIPLAPGAQYTVERDILLTANFAPGDWQLMIAPQGVDPGGDSSFSVPITLQAPDLALTGAQAPASAMLGVPIEVSWTVNNVSAVSALGSWSDVIYLSQDDILDENDVPVHSEFTGDRAPLAAGGNYQAQAQVTIPSGAAGNYLIFAANGGHNQAETDYSNNVTVLPIQLTAPDLVVSSVQGPTLAMSGDTITISWTITNQSSVAASGTWIDHVYLSGNPTTGGGSGGTGGGGVGGGGIGGGGIGGNVGGGVVVIDNPPIGGGGVGGGGSGSNGDIDLGTLQFTGTLEAGQSIVRSQTFTLARDLSGTFHVRVHTNDGNQFVESNLNNNDDVSDQAIDVQLSPFPNLAVSNVTAPAGAYADHDVVIEWTVANVGEATSDQSSWMDKIWLSADQTVGFGDTLLAQVDNLSNLAPGESYHNQLTVHVPANTSGSYYILVQTDASNQVYELDRETDNVGSSQQASIQLPLSDLQILSADAPTSAKLNDQIDVSWTVKNIGLFAATGHWPDWVYWSDDDVLNYGDTPTGGSFVGDFGFGTVYQETPIAPGDTYQLHATLQLPYAASNLGDKYLIFTINDGLVANRYLQESEYGNNIIALPIRMTAPDLVVSQVQVPTQALIGDQITITWQLTNQGDAVATGTWTDAVYLATDKSGGNIPTGFGYSIGQDDIFAGYIDFSGTIQPGQTVSREITATLPRNKTGLYYGRVLGGALIESRLDNNQAYSDAGLQISRPDLAITSVQTAASALSGDHIVITWQVTNHGTMPATGWTDHLYLARNNQQGGDILLGSFEFTSILAPGQTAVRSQEFTLPIHESGNFYVQVLSNENTLNVFSDRTLRVQLSPFPNLAVTQVTAPLNIFSEQQTVIEWIVTNVGEGDTSTPTWYDSVWLSTDQTLDSSDMFMGQVANVSYLRPGEGYASKLTVTLPRGIDGTYYFLVKTDQSNLVDELDRKSENVRAAAPTQVTITPFPDLQVTAVAGPIETFSGQAISITYTVENRGPGEVREFVWTDAVFVSTIPTLDASARKLGEVVHVAFGNNGALDFLESGQSYTASTKVVLPVDLQGDFYILVATDAYNGVYEYLFETNNVGASAATMRVRLQPPPDLEVTTVQVAPQARSGPGQAMNVRYTVANHGSIVTPNQYWTDTVYLSSSPVFDRSNVVAQASYYRFGALPVDGSYQAEISLPLDAGRDGNFYVFVEADSSQSVYEVNRDNNRVRSANPIHVRSLPADLLVTSVAAPSAADAGKKIRVEWTVSNLGTGDTMASNWSDSVYYSIYNNFNSGTATLLGTVSHQGLLDVGESYSTSATFTLPLSTSGTIYLFVESDRFDEVYRTDYGDANSVRNVSQPFRIDVHRELADLQITSLSSAASVQVGAALDVQYTVKNKGNAVTDSSFWYDAVYLSFDGSLNNAYLLGTYRRTNPLKAGESYQVNKSFTIPWDLPAPSQYYLLVTTDYSGKVTEAENAANNTTTAVQRVNVTPPPPEGGSGGGSSGGGGGTNSRPQTYDLALSQVQIPDSAVSGLPVTVTWTVFNAGDPITAVWYDAVYLSLDQFLDGSDIFLGYAAHNTSFRPPPPPGEVAIPVQPLDAGESYTQEGTFRVPAGLSGLYYALVQTDSSNRLNEINEQDNLGVAPGTILISLQAPADLVAGTLIIPASAEPGDSITLHYSVHNDGTTAAQGSWYDALYLSADDHWDVGDVFLGRALHVGGVAGGSSYNGALATRLPGVVPGEYHVIVRSDILNNVRELSEDNNVSASLDTVDIQVPRLELGTPVNGILMYGTFAYYQVDVEEGQALRVNLDYANPSFTTTSELYVRYGAMPTRGQFDFAYSNPHEADQQILVPNTRAGTYYILAYTVSGPISSGGPNAVPLNQFYTYSLTADTIQFSVLDEGYGKGGTAGSRTIQINGAKFDRTVTAKLVNDAGFELAASAIYFVDSSRVYATFDLTRVSPGKFDVVVENNHGQSDRVDDGLEVVAGGAGRLVVDMLTPTGVRAGNYPISFLVTWYNDGLTDIAAPYIEVGSSNPLGFDAASVRNDALHVFGRGSGDGPAGILLPVQSGQVRVFLQIQGAGDIQVWTDTLGSGQLDDFFPWETSEAVRNATSRTGDAFTELVNQLRTQVGPRWRDFLAMLSRNANLIPAELGNPSNIRDLVAMEVRQAEAALTNSIRGTIQADDADLQLGGRVVRLINTETFQLTTGIVLNDGSFVFANLAPGSYEIDVPGAALINRADARVTLADGQKVNGLALRIDSGATLDLTVRDATGNPAADALVHVFDGDQLVATAFTDADGRVRLTALPSGTFTLVAQSSVDLSHQVMQIQIETGRQELAVDLQAGARVVGRIVPASSDGFNFGTILVQRLNDEGFANFVTASKKDGSFILQGLVPGQYQATIYKSGFADRTVEFSVAAGQDEINLGDVSLQPAMEGAIVGQGIPIVVGAAYGLFVFGMADLIRDWIAAYNETLSYYGMNSTTIEPADKLKVEIIKKLVPESMSPFIWSYMRGFGRVATGAFNSLANSLQGEGEGDDVQFQPVTGLLGAWNFNGLLYDFLSGSGEFRYFNSNSTMVSTFFRDQPKTIARIKEAYKNAIDGFKDLLAARQISGSGFFTLKELIDAHSKATGQDLSWLYSVDGNSLVDKSILDDKWQWAPPNPAGGVGGGDMSVPMARTDARFLTGDFWVDVDLCDSSITLTPINNWTFTVVDWFDFVPGNLGPGTLVKMGTFPLAVLEAYGWAKDVPFEVEWTNDNTFLKPEPLPLPAYLTPEGHVCDDDDPYDLKDKKDKKDIKTFVAQDPNDIIGPAGFGDEHWVSVNNTLPYTIRFENDPLLANAPAQVVRIVQQLDSDLDLRTFRLGDFGFGDIVITAAAGRAFYQDRIDLVASKGYYLDVIAGVDVTSGEAFWDLRSIDPATGEVFSDPTKGFLPPNIANGEGDGFVAYTIKPKAASPTGTRIDAQATIIFDINAPIDTPPIFNTIDAGTPRTTEAGATAEQTTTASGFLFALDSGNRPSSTLFRVSWEARDEDEGSGIASYTVYVSDNGGPLQVWLQDTPDSEALFEGIPGHRYEFYIVPRNFAGNEGSIPDTPDVVIQLPGGDTTAPTSHVNALSAVSQPRFLVSWSGSDDAGGTGIASYDIYASVNGGAFQIWQRQVTSSSAVYNGLAGYRYAFYSVARDRSGNLEAAPAAADTRTIVSGSLNGVIAGQLFVDADGDNFWDAGEAALQGWTVILDHNDNGQRDDGEETTVSDEDGSFLFANIKPGTYTVTPVLPAGWQPTWTTSAHTIVSATTGSPAPISLALESTDTSGHTGGDPRALIGLDALLNDARFTGLTGQGFNVAILDTGIDPTHSFFGPDLDGNGVADAILAQVDFVHGDNTATDANNHGSSVAGVIASRDGQYPGVAPGAGLIVLQVLDDNGQGSFAVVERALQWLVLHAAEYHIAAVNLSFGDLGHYSGDVSMYGIGDELAALARQNVIVVAAAGNAYQGQQGVSYPAADPNVLAVGAVYDGDKGGPFQWGSGVRDNTSAADRIASFSERQPGDTVFAPGVLITGAAANGGIVTLSGTSLAVPYVSGAAVLAQQLAVREFGRMLTPAEFRQLLVTTGKTIHDGDDEDDNVVNTGADYSRLDVHALAEAILALPKDGTGSGATSGNPAAGTGYGPGSQTLPEAVIVTIGPGDTVGNLRLGFRSASAPRSDVLTYQSPTGNGADDLVLRKNGATIEIFESHARSVVASRSLADIKLIQITGADGENDSLTIDFEFGGYFTLEQGIEFAGGSGGMDSLRIVGNGATTGTYAPSATTTGNGSSTVAAGGQSVTITFTGLEPVEVSKMASWTFVTPNGADDVVIRAGTGKNGEAAAIIAGTSGGVLLESLTYFKIPTLTLDLATNDGISADDSVLIDSNGRAAGGSVNHIVSHVIVKGGAGVDQLTLDDSGDQTADVVTISATTIGGGTRDSFFGPRGKVSYDGISKLLVKTGRADDTIQIQATATGTSTTVQAGAGNDTFLVSSDAGRGTTAGNLNGIQGALTLDAGRGAMNRMIVSNFGGAPSNNIAVTKNQITGLTPAAINYKASGGGFAGNKGGIVIIGSNAGPDVFHVLGTLAGSTTKVAGKGGNDTFYVGSTPEANDGNLNSIAGALIVDGGQGQDRLYVNDHGAAARRRLNYLLTPTFIGNGTGTHRPFAGVQYSGIESLRLDGSDGLNTFFVKPSTNTTYYLDGNGPAGNKKRRRPGDTIQLDASDASVRALAFEHFGKGYWSFNGHHRKVSFEDIEYFNVEGKRSSPAPLFSGSPDGIKMPTLESAWAAAFAARP